MPVPPVFTSCNECKQLSPSKTLRNTIKKNLFGSPSRGETHDLLQEEQKRTCGRIKFKYGIDLEDFDRVENNRRRWNSATTIRSRPYNHSTPAGRVSTQRGEGLPNVPKFNDNNNNNTNTDTEATVHVFHNINGERSNKENTDMSFLSDVGVVCLLYSSNGESWCSSSSSNNNNTDKSN
ncbi:uncharacterized protein LOC115620834 [Scaptodrosophila lebanonensis]|uniref:Uncharacterized protein LOC115620834 n=1 Tax=Drosophila lebanonensis TaxID=7225 RepID=A0A6J2T5C0_DROLE|nr:uncharacterized protein LOC115620834 [Scaptodrosophila lebanonensis]